MPPTILRPRHRTEVEIYKLKDLPKRCPLAPEDKDIGSEIRQLVIGKRRGKYRVLFRVEAHMVQVLRVVHGMREHLTTEELAEAGW